MADELLSNASDESGGLQLQAKMKKKSVAATATAIVENQLRNHIPDDLAFSILSKLPFKSLRKFGCVCKSWALLFENNSHFMNIFRSYFISNHHSYYEDTSLLLCLTVPPVIPHFNSSLFWLFGERFQNRVKLEWPNPFQEDDPIFLILGSTSVNGFLCLYRVPTKLVLWNPTTDECKVIPPSPVESVPLNQDPSATLYGFGYDSVRDDYKVIREVNFYENTHDDEHALMDWVPLPDPVWEIYSLRSNSWRKLDTDMPYYHVDNDGLYLDGMCHWLGITSYNNNNEDKDKALVSFDLSHEVFFTTLVPLDIPSDMYDTFYFYLVLKRLFLLNGSIAVISSYADTTTFYISILTEVGVKESWIKLFIVGPLPFVERPIGIGKMNDIFFGTKDGELAWFDLSTNMMEKLDVKGCTSCCGIVIYKENPLPIVLV